MYNVDTEINKRTGGGGGDEGRREKPAEVQPASEREFSRGLAFGKHHSGSARSSNFSRRAKYFTGTVR